MAEEYTFPPKAKRVISAEKTDITIGAVFLNAYRTKPSYLQAVWSGVGEKCREENIALQIFSIPQENAGSQSNPFLWSHLKKKKIKGLILTSRLPVDDIALLNKQRVPFVWLDNDFPFQQFHSCRRRFRYTDCSRPSCGP